MIDPERGIEMPARTRRFMQELAGRNFDAGARGAAKPARDAAVRPTTASVPRRVPVSLMVVACVVALLVGLAWQLAL